MVKFIENFISNELEKEIFWNTLFSFGVNCKEIEKYDMTVDKLVKYGKYDVNEARQLIVDHVVEGREIPEVSLLLLIKRKLKECNDEFVY